MRYQHFGPEQSGWHDAAAFFGWFLPLLLLVVIVIGAVLWFQRSRPALPSAAKPADTAVAELRLRYARGEVDRDEYLRRVTDLGEAPPPPPPSAG